MYVCAVHHHPAYILSLAMIGFHSKIIEARNNIQKPMARAQRAQSSDHTDMGVRLASAIHKGLLIL